MSRLMSMVQQGEAIPPGTVGLTFDDGFRSFLVEAWPILKRAGFSATVFVPIDFVGASSSWHADYGLPPVPCLDWDELRQLRDEGADIQSHGCSHRKMTELAEPELMAELQRSKETLSTQLGVDSTHFCYPFGSFNAAVKQATVKCGYQSAVSTIPGLYQAGDDPYELRREGLDSVHIPDAETANLIISACVDGSYPMYINAKLAFLTLFGARSPGKPARPAS